MSKVFGGTSAKSGEVSRVPFCREPNIHVGLYFAPEQLTQAEEHGRELGVENVVWVRFVEPRSLR
jgi:hypothetical protein